MGAVESQAAPLRFRALPLSELLDETFRLYRRHFEVIAGVSLAIVIPGLTLTLLSGSYRFNPFTAIQQVFQNPNDPAALQTLQQRQNEVFSSPFFWLSIVVTIFLVPFMTGALFRAATELSLGHPATIGSVLADTLRRYFAILGVLILEGLVGISLITLIGIPLVIWVLVRWAVAVPALFAERAGPAAALGRSWQLVKGLWWRTLGILLIVYIMVTVIQTALGVLFLGLAGLVPGVSEDLRSALVTAASQLVQAVVAPIFPIAITLLYFDLRVRKEGFDLEQLAGQAAPGPAPA